MPPRPSSSWTSWGPIFTSMASLRLELGHHLTDSGSVGGVGSELDVALEVRDRALDVALPVPRLAADDQGQTALGVELERLRRVGDRPVPFALPSPRIAPELPGSDEGGVELDRLRRVGDRL